MKWLTIPIKVKGRYKQKIQDAIIADKRWALKHWDTIKHCYNSAPFYENYEYIFGKTYQNCREMDSLSEVNRLFINLINSILGITTIISGSADYKLEGNKSEKIISICKQAKAEVYLSGPSAKNYLDEELFRKEDIKLSWVDYNNYPEYNQLNPPFDHNVSILDLIFNEGQDAGKFMKSF